MLYVIEEYGRHVRIRTGNLYRVKSKYQVIQQLTGYLGLPQLLIRPFPSWFPIAGFITGALTLIFFMVISLLGMFPHAVPLDDRFIVVIVLAFGLAMSFSFIGGSAAASGRIPFFQKSPIRFSAGGGIAVFVVVLLTGWKM